MDADDYSDGNRAFLQAFLSRGTLTLSEAKSIIAAIATIENGDNGQVEAESITRNDFDSYMHKATDALTRFDYQVRSTQHQVSGERTWAIVNNESDAVTKLATTRSPDDLAFIKRLLDAMFDARNTPRQEVMALSETEALNLRRPKANTAEEEETGQTQKPAEKSLTMSEAGDLLKTLVGEGWLEKTRNKHYTLTPRGLLELQSWLVESYNDPDAQADEWQRIKFCVACKKIVTIGQRCTKRDCNIRLHDICSDAYWRSRREQTCPRCQTAWDGEHYVGDRTVGRDRDHRRRNRRSEVQGEEDGEMDEQDT